MFQVEEKDVKFKEVENVVVVLGVDEDEEGLVFFYNDLMFMVVSILCMFEVNVLDICVISDVS